MFPGTATRDFWRIGHFQSLLLTFSANKRHSSYPGADFSCTWTYLGSDISCSRTYSGPDLSRTWTSPVPGHILYLDLSCTRTYSVPGHIQDLTYPIPGHIDLDFSWTCPQKRLEEADIDGENAGYQDGRSVCVI